MKQFIISSSMFAAGLAFSGVVNAGSAVSPIIITATAVPTCSVVTNTLGFGSVTGLQTVHASSDISVNCTPGLPYHISLDAGFNYNKVLHFRQITDSALNSRTYFLYSDIISQVEWGDSDYANTYPNGTSVADTGNGAVQPHTIYGQLSSSSAALPPGSYVDIVVATVNY
jgi:spore coat protein U-like protein